MKALKANNADIDRLQTEIDALSAHLGLLHSKPSDPRLTLAERAIGEESPARQELTNARQRAAKERPRDALRPARAIDDETRLTAADRSKLAEVEELAARMERAQEIDAPTRAKEIEQAAVQQLKRMGLLDSDEATDFRVRLASSAFEADSPGLRLLTKTRTERRAEFAGSNDVLRPGFRPGSRSVLSANDRVQLGIVSGKKSRPIVRILQELMHAERRNASDIEAIRQAAEDEMRALGLGSRDKAAEKQANLVIMALGGPNSRFGGRFAEIRQSALENVPPTGVRPATAEAQPPVDIAGRRLGPNLLRFVRHCSRCSRMSRSSDYDSMMRSITSIMPSAVSPRATKPPSRSCSGLPYESQVAASAGTDFAQHSNFGTPRRDR